MLKITWVILPKKEDTIGSYQHLTLPLLVLYVARTEHLSLFLRV